MTLELRKNTEARRHGFRLSARHPPDEVGEVWDIKDDLIEEDYVEGVEYRSVDLRDNDLQVFANANKAKQLESREDMAYRGRWSSGF